MPFHCSFTKYAFLALLKCHLMQTFILIGSSFGIFSIHNFNLCNFKVSGNVPSDVVWWFYKLRLNGFVPAINKKY